MSRIGHEGTPSWQVEQLRRSQQEDQEVSIAATEALMRSGITRTLIESGVEGNIHLHVNVETARFGVRYDPQGAPEVRGWWDPIDSKYYNKRIDRSWSLLAVEGLWALRTGAVETGHVFDTSQTAVINELLAASSLS